MLVVIFGLLAAVQARPNDEATCDSVLEDIKHRNIYVPKMEDLNLRGVWISERCEVRPGPEYILRRYHFMNDTHFQVLQFYYTDPYCSLPFYGLAANGILHQGGRRMSWFVDGATEAPQPVLLQVNVMPYNREAALYLQNKAGGSSGGLCSRHILQQDTWRPAKGPFVILSYVEYKRKVLRDLDCTAGIGFNLNEFQLLRMEEETEMDGRVRRRLHLGSVATQFRKRASFKPSSFQAALVDQKSSDCRLCSSLRYAMLKDPPIINDHLSLPHFPHGEWVSSRCESRNQGQFVNRRLLFENDNQTWHGYYYYYHDVLCHRPHFTIYASGRSTRKEPSKENADAWNYDFLIERVRIIPQDERSLLLFNEHKGDECGIPGQWVINVGQDVTSTNGCDLLKVRIPERKPQVIRVEKTLRYHLLLIGELPNTEESSSRRATSFQPALMRCRKRVSSRGGGGQPNLAVSPPRSQNGQKPVQYQTQNRHENKSAAHMLTSPLLHILSCTCACAYLLILHVLPL